MGDIFKKTVGVASGSDKLVLLDIREPLIQPIQAPDWTDLRIGMYLSVTTAAASDAPGDPTIAELINPAGGDPTAAILAAHNRYWIGFKDRSKVLPTEAGTQFIGWTCPRPPLRLDTSQGPTELLASDYAVGTATSLYYWRVANTASTILPTYLNFFLFDGNQSRGGGDTGEALHFVKDTTARPNYAVLAAIRIQRDSKTSKRLTVTIPTDGVGASDLGYTNDPTKSRLRTTLEAWTTGAIKTHGPVDFSKVPDSLFVFWPFRQSRLRIHEWGFIKAG
jgi:hypothetical protein